MARREVWTTDVVLRAEPTIQVATKTSVDGVADPVAVAIDDVSMRFAVRT